MHLKTILAASLMASTLCSCISEEPLNQECDITRVEIQLEQPLTIFYHDYEAIVADVPYTSDSIRFKARSSATIGSMPLSLTLTPGATAYRGTDTEPFENGTLVDFSGEQRQYFRVVSEDGQWNRIYRIFVEKEKETEGTLNLPLESYEPEEHGRYYIWKAEGDAENIWTDGVWKNGNPGFAISRSSAKQDEYPTIPIPGGGPDGSDCVKMETCSTGKFGQMANMRIASGSFFNGIFDVSNALSNALAATRFGSPFKYAPHDVTVWMKFEPGEDFQNVDGTLIPGVVDEPDAYVLLYRNTDEEGNPVMLDGTDVLTSPYIVGKARLPHHYTADGRDKLSSEPIHGITSEWQEVHLTVEYTQEPDPTILANNGYSIVVGFASSWQGAYFKGAVGSKLWIDNIIIK